MSGDKIEHTRASVLSPREEAMLENMVKEVFNGAVEQPWNAIAKGLNKIAGTHLPELHLTGAPEKPPSTVKFIKA